MDLNVRENANVDQKMNKQMENQMPTLHLNNRCSNLMPTDLYSSNSYYILPDQTLFHPKRADIFLISP